MLERGEENPAPPLLIPRLPPEDYPDQAAGLGDSEDTR